MTQIKRIFADKKISVNQYNQPYQCTIRNRTLMTQIKRIFADKKSV